MNEKYYVGSYRDDGLNEPNRGWIVGKFKDTLPRKNNDVEIKYWEYDVGATDHPTKESNIIDYVVIHPGTKNNTVVEILEPTTGLTVKSPSDPSAKRVVS
jgi:hypothetical protein